MRTPTPDFTAELIGRVFTRLTVVSYAGQDKAGNRLWVCRCNCGTPKTVIHTHLIRGRVRSCGCLIRDTAAVIGRKSRKHGHGKPHTPTYNVWHGMKCRCLNPNNSRFKDYGGRGISICDRWLDFANFLADMGPRPEGRSLDRIDNSGNYEPSNCRWATRKQQQNNMKSNAHLEYQGKRQTVSEWAVEIGMTVTALSTRLRRGWSVSDALTRAVSKKAPRRPYRTSTPSERCSTCRHPESSFDRQLGFCTWQLDQDRLCGCKCPRVKRDKEK